MTGQSVSHYRILEPIGEGGMGEVFKAEDTRLNRIVALKFLSQEMTGKGEHAERFLREAQAAASLDHPNICTTYEIDEQDGRTFIAMAFLEGESLDKLIERGPLPLSQAVEIAKQAAEGLVAAHQSGVVHRDIKPTNMIVSKSTAGREVIKLMDFGLAQVSGRSKLTQVESRLGTIAYMSPEQAQGDLVDQRSDLWSLGVVLYEMVTGELPFKGHYDQAILYSTLNEDPQPVTSLRSRVPMELEWIVEKCLAKSPADRYQEGRELVVDLERLQKRMVSGKTVIQPLQQSEVVPQSLPVNGHSDPDQLGTIVTSQQSQSSASGAVSDVLASQTAIRPKWLTLKVGFAGLMLVMAVVVLLILGQGRSEDDKVLRRFTIRPVEAIETDQRISHSAISPDGRYIAFTTSGSRGMLWLQSLDRHELIQIVGTRGAREVFWAPDSSAIGFRTNNGLKTVTLRGYTITTLVDAESGLGFGTATWSADGESIYFSSFGGQLMQVSKIGGTPNPLFEDAPLRRHLIRKLSVVTTSADIPVLLYSEHTPDRDHVIFRHLTGSNAGEVITLLEGSNAVYSQTGHILYQPSSMTSAMWAIKVSLSRLETEGDAFPIAQNASEVSVSADGTLVYLDNPLSGQKRLIWVNRSGEEIGEIGKPQTSIMGPRISPGGDKILALGGSGRNFDLWVHETARPVLNRLSFDDMVETGAIWSYDGKRVAFTQRGSQELKGVTVGGGALPQVITSFNQGPFTPLDWSRDGRYILYRRLSLQNQITDISANSIGTGSETAQQSRFASPVRTSIGYFEYLQSEDRWEAHEYIPESPFMVEGAVFSPNGRYVAYQSNESEDVQIYVKPFPDGDERWQVSTEGGVEPRWSSDGNELYYTREETLYSVNVRTGKSFQMGETEPLFSSPNLFSSRRFSAYDAGPEGRFVLVDLLGNATSPAIRISLNWFTEFKEL